MEFVMSKEGKTVKKSYKEIVDHMTSKNESLSFSGIGSTPTSGRFMNRRTGKTQEIDFRRVAAMNGYKDVQFKLDIESAKKQGFYDKDYEPDNAVAYNVERIKSESGRMKYLQDKGFKNVVNSGDEYYAVVNGKLANITNEEGLDSSDFMRFFAHAGRDVGAIIGVATTGIGAAATGGTTLALAGAAGAGGAVVGESAQRIGDKLFGADAAKYNEELSFSEEAQEMVKTAGVGAIEGVTGQFAGKAIGALGTAATKGASKVAQRFGIAEEATANLALKTESKYLASKLPQGWLSKTGSAEEQTALKLMNEASFAKNVTTAERKSIMEEGKGNLALGAAKDTGQLESIEEAQKQLVLRKAYNQQLQMKAEQESKEMASKAIETSNAKERFEQYKERYIAKAYEHFKEKEVDNIVQGLNNKIGVKEAKKSMFNLQKANVKRFETYGAKPMFKEGNFQGFESSSFDTAYRNMIEEDIKVSGKFIEDLSFALDFENPVEDFAKSSVKESIEQGVSMLKNEESKKIFRSYLEDIGNHIGGKTEARESFLKAMRQLEELSGVEDRDALELISDGVINFATASSKNVGVGFKIGQIAKKRLSVIEKSFKKYDSEQLDDVIQYFGEMKDMNALMNAEGNVSNLASLLYNEAASKGSKADVLQFMSPLERERVNILNTLQGVLNEKAIGKDISGDVFSKVFGVMKGQTTLDQLKMSDYAEMGLAYLSGGKSYAVKKAWQFGGKRAAKASLRATGQVFKNPNVQRGAVSVSVAGG